jgi:hypothetical protein
MWEGSRTRGSASGSSPKGWVAICSVTGLLLILLGAVQPNSPLIVFGAPLIPLGVGLDGILHQRKNRNTRDLVRRV